MTLTIELTLEEEDWLHNQPTQSELPPAEIVKRLVDERLLSKKGSPQSETTMPTVNAEGDATIAMLTSWLQEDATDDPEEIRKAEEELREFMRTMNAQRKENGERLLFPEVE